MFHFNSFKEKNLSSTKKISKNLFFTLLCIAIILVSVIAFSGTSYVKQFITQYNSKRDVLEDMSNWELHLVMYDSEIDNGRTQLTEHEWNAEKNETRVITVQINYKNKEVKNTYNPGDISISIDNLGKVYPINSTGNSYAEVTSISADPKNSSDKSYDWSYQYDSSTNKYTFTNNNTIEENSNFEGTIQLAYKFEAQYLLNGADITINAKINDVVESSNKLNFKFTSTEKEATMTKRAEKIQSYDGLGENASSYIWVKYYVSVTNSSTDNVRQNVYDHYLSENIQEDCLVYDGDLKKIEPNEKGEYNIPFDVENGSFYNYYGHTYYYVAYPISKYENEKITSKTEWYGKIKDSYYYNGEEKEQKLLAEKSIDIELSGYKIEIPENEYYISKGINSKNISYKKLTNPNIGEDISFYHYFSSLYSGKKMTVKIGDDLLYISKSDDTYRKLTDDEYYFKNIQINTRYWHNANDIDFETEKYDIKLYVRYRGENDYVQYGDTFKNKKDESKNITFNKDEFVVGWYIEVDNLNESIIAQNTNTITSTVHIQANNDIPENGKIYNYNYIQVFKENEEGRLELSSAIEQDEYSQMEKQLGIDVYDLEKYGNYIKRDSECANYGLEYISHSLVTYMGSESQNNEFFFRKFRVQVRFGSETTGTEKYNGYRTFVILPEGVELDATKEEIIESVTNAYSYNKLKKQDGSAFSNQQEYIQFIKEHTTITIDKNYKNEGKTWIEIKVDYTDNPLNTYDVGSYNTLEEFYIPIKIPYESYFTYGMKYTVSAYITLLHDEEEYYVSYNKTTDRNDVDNDGSTDDYYTSYGSSTTTIVPAVSSYQEVNKSVWTDNSENQWLSDLASVGYNGKYKYKLRVRTGINNISKLVIYDNIEKDGEWQGTFDGIDLSFTKGQGFDPKVYYSTSSTAGTLTDDRDSWNEYTEEIDKTTVKSIAFDFQDQIIPSGYVTYVIINMKAPNDLESTKLTSNGCYTKWTALDLYGHPIDDITGISSNVSLLGVPSSKRDLTIYKKWEDDEDSLGVRPKSVNITVFKNEEEYEKITLTEEEKWQKTIEVPVSDPDGNKYDYTVKEEKVNLYDSKVEDTSEETESGTVFSYTITNTIREDDVYLDIYGQKTWDDEDDRRGRRPEEITINLLRDGEVIDSTTTNEYNDWEYEFLHYKLWKNNSETYKYEIEEEELDYYTSKLTEIHSNGLTIKFSPDSVTEAENFDYVEIYYTFKGKTYKAGKWGGNNIANTEVTIPAKEFYLYWHTDVSVNEYYGFKIENVKRAITKIDPTLGSSTSLPHYDAEEVKDFKLIESEHSPYSNDVDKLWHYKADDTLEDIESPEDAVENLRNINIENSYKMTPSNVFVHYYILNTTNPVPTVDGFASDVTKTGIVGDEYETEELDNVSEDYELAQTSSNTTGTFEIEDTHVYYYYQPVETSVLVQHHILNTDEKVPAIEGGYVDDVIINGRVGYAYETEEAENVKPYYELVEVDGQRSGNMTKNQIVVTYYYDIKDPTIIEPQLTKTATREIKDKNDKIEYNISYTTSVDEYIGNATLTIVDTLPYHIDVEKSNYGDGIYNNDNKTITWTKEITGIDTLTEGEPKEITFEQKIEIVYTDIDLDATIIENNVKANLHFEKPEIENEVENKATTDVDFSKKITVNKVWEDDDNLLGKRPENILISVKDANGNVAKYKNNENAQTRMTGTENTWTYTFENLPKYNEDGTEKIYTVEEEILKLYKAELGALEDKGENEYELTITNKLQVTDIEVKKIWNDEQDRANKRPKIITLIVKDSDGNIAKDIDGNNAEAIARGKEDIWTHTFENLPKYNEDGTEKTYTVDETGLEGTFYNKSIDGYVITNTFQVPDDKAEITISKVWQDNNNFAKRRPSSVVLTLIGDGNKYDYELSAPENDNLDVWSLSVNDLPKYDKNGDEIIYVLSEKNINNDFYPDNLKIVNQGTMTVTNVFSPPNDKINIPVEKVWKYENDAQKAHIPESVTFELNSSDTAVQNPYARIDLKSDKNEVTTNKSTTWKSEFKNLPKYDSQGIDIQYTVSEKINDLFYKQSGNPVIDETGKVTITNEFIRPEDKVKITVNKIWIENELQKTKRPDSIIISLNANNTEIETKEISEQDNWSYTFENLYKYDENGDIINYTVQEKEKTEGDLKYYTTDIKGNIDSKLTITNKSNYAQVRVHHIEKQTGEVFDEYILEGKVGEPYVTDVSPKVPDTYGLVEVPKNKEGIFKEEITDVYYYYLQKTKVIVNHIDKNTEDKMLVEEIEGLVGDEYKTSAKDFDGYILVEKPDEEEGLMEKEVIVKNYYYAHISMGIIEKHVDIVTNDLLENSILHEGNEGDPYHIDSKEFEGYDLVTNKKYYEKYVESNPDFLKENEVETIEDLLEKLELLPEEPYIPKNFEGKMTKEAIEVVYYYIHKSDVKVEYRDVITGETIKETKYDESTKTEEIVDSTDMIYGHEEDPYETNPKEFEDYVLQKEPENKKGVMTKEEEVVTYYYIHKSAGVLEKHIDIITKETIEDPVLYKGNEGDPYTTNSKEFEGYDLVTNKKYYEKYVEEHPDFLKENDVSTIDELLEKLKLSPEKIYIPENYKGTMKIEEIEVDYYYIHTSSVKVEYKDKNTGETLEEVETDEKTNKKQTKDSTEIFKGYEGDIYETKEKQFENYVLVEEPENKNGVMTKEEQVVTYYYAHESAGVIERHINLITGELLEKETIYSGHEGDPYETKEKQFEGFDIVKSKMPINAKGTMTIDRIEVNYYYARKYELRIEHYDNETNQKIVEDEVRVVHEGEEYTTDYKVIEGYDVLSNKMPDNKKGVVKQENITVRYFYEKKVVKTPTPPTVVYVPSTNSVNTANDDVKTGDNLPIIAIGTIIIVVAINIIQIVISRKKKKSAKKD